MRIPLIFLLAAAPILCQAPAGHVTWSDPEVGLSIFAPKHYTQIPQQPTEVVIRASWERRDLPDELEKMRGAMKPRIALFLYRKNQTARATGPSTDKPAEEEPASLRELMEKHGQVQSFDEFMQKKLPGWTPLPADGRTGEWNLSYGEARANPGPGDLSGFLVQREERGYVFGLYGFSHHAANARLRREMAAMFRGLNLPSESKAGAKTDAREAEVRRIYRGKNFRAIDHRVRVRLGLASGWKAEDTENYIIVYKTRNEPLINRIAKDVEAMRLLYADIFPPSRPIEAVSIIRILPNLVEYHTYGGPQGSGGFWHPGNEELVLFDYDQERRDAEREKRASFIRDIGNKDSMLVLKHEAFHQWIYYAVGEISPHYWFNEGHGDYFSGAVTSNQSARILRIEPSSWRLDLARDLAENARRKIPLKTLLYAERSTYYNPQQAGLFYAAGWSFVYFMREAEEVRNHPKWSKFLNAYFDTLKSAYTEELAKFGEKPGLDDKETAAARARARAIEAATEGIDLAELEAAWEKYIRGVRAPTPS